MFTQKTDEACLFLQERSPKLARASALHGGPERPLTAPPVESCADVISKWLGIPGTFRWLGRLGCDSPSLRIVRDRELPISLIPLVFNGIRMRSAAARHVERSD